MRGVVGVAAGWVSISVVAGVLAAHPVVFAQAKPKPAPASAGVETFTGTATNVPKAGEPFTFRLSRWSTDGDRDQAARHVHRKRRGRSTGRAGRRPDIGLHLDGGDPRLLGALRRSHPST